jgi:subtilisin family serine protease
MGYEAMYGRLDEASRSPLDTIGHGTHTASTAAGSAVADASFFNYARGEAVGMAPGARIAAYKVCWEKGCATSDVLAAFDKAIADGVDVISASFGANGVVPKLHEDAVAVGAFSAVRDGIVVSATAGGDGPDESTLNDSAPWFITVAASSVNRSFPADVVLGNGETITGASLYVGTTPLAKT